VKRKAQRIVITEFMDGSAVDALAGQHDTLYDPGLVDRAPALMAAIADADALIVRKSDAGESCAARGSVETGKLAGAALDVFEQEALPAGSPLAGCPNLILTPHIAGVTRESNARVSTMIATRVAAFLAAR
jgi:(S)-sulfolactate dehydrogenase